MNAISAPSRVLVTGSSGFTGRFVVQCLQDRGYEVYGLGAGQDRGNLAADRYHVCSLLDKETLTNVVQKVMPDYVFHLAAKAFVADSDIQGFYLVNVVGTRNLLDALLQIPVKPKGVLVASSANIYGGHYSGAIKEDFAPNPMNDYAISKLASEYVVRLYQDRLPIVITRPFNYTGVGQEKNFVIPKIVDHFIQKKSSIELGNIDVYREFNDVRDVANIYVRLIEEGQYGKVFNIASGKMISLKDVIKACSRITQHTLEIKVNPAFVRPNEVTELCGDFLGLQVVLNEYPFIYSTADTLEWMLRGLNY